MFTKKWLLLGGLLLCAGATMSYAEIDAVSTVDEFVVTATRSKVPQKNVSASVQVFTAKEIAERGAQDLSDLLRDAAGVNITQTGTQGAQTSLFMRGAESDHTLILIDGVRVNQAGGSMSLAHFPLENVERIEILRGPQSAIYGSDAIGGVVQIFTKNAQQGLGGELKARGGNLNTFEESLLLSYGWQTGGIYTDYSRKDSDGHLILNNNLKQNYYNAALHQDILPNLHFNFGAHFTEAEFHYPNSGGDLLTAQTQWDPRQQTNTRRLTLSSKLDWQTFDFFSQELSLGYNRERSEQIDPIDSGIDFYDANSDTKNLRKSLDYFWHIKVPELAGLNQQLDLGAAFEKEDFNNKDASNDINLWRTNSAFILQNQFNWKEILFLTPGARFEDNKNYGSATSPRITGGVYIPMTMTKLRSSWGKGLRAPAFSELFNTAWTTGNRDLRPERSETWEVGFDQYSSNGWVTLSMVYFKTHSTDLIAYDSASTINYFNIQSADLYGTESTLKLDIPIKSWKLGFTAVHNFLHTKVADNGGLTSDIAFQNGRPLLRRPEHKTAFAFNISRDGFNFNLNTTHVGEFYDSFFNSNTFSSERVLMPGYDKIDLAGAYRVWKSNPEVWINLKVQNLTNVKYQEVYGYSNSPAIILGGFTVKF